VSGERVQVFKSTADRIYHLPPAALSLQLHRLSVCQSYPPEVTKDWHATVTSEEVVRPGEYGGYESS
jgi:hypothetical protein